MATLRSFIFLDQLQPQTMCYLGTWIKGSLPRRMSVTPPAIQTFVPAGPNLRACWKRDHDGSSTCTRRVSTAGSITAATDRRLPFRSVISARLIKVGLEADLKLIW